MLRALGLGDLLTAVPALRALRNAFPEARVELATPLRLAPLAKLTGAVDAVVPAAPLEPLPARVRRPDLAVNLHGRGPESHRILEALAPARLLAFAAHAVPSTRGFPRWLEDEHEVERWCRLLREHGVDGEPGSLSIAPPADGHGLPSGATVIHPGAASPARRWPPERWAAVARAEAEAGRTVVVTGSRAERPLAAHVAAAAGLPASAVLAGRTGIEALAFLVGRADLVLSGDTGIAHLATALATPSVVIFGPVSPERWGPPAGSAIHRVLWGGYESDPWGAAPAPSLLSVDVADVLSAIVAVRRAAADEAPPPASSTLARPDPRPPCAFRDEPAHGYDRGLTPT